MKRLAPLALLASALALPASAEEAVTPISIVAAAPAADWVEIDPADLMVMDLAPDRDGNARRVVIQLMPAPFSQGWVGNIRQLDRNIALVGRVIEGIEHLSSLPRGKSELGFYGDDEAGKRVPILSVWIGAEARDLPRFEYLSTESRSFAAYAHSRANRQDDFYKVPAGGADICNVPVPIRRVGAE